MSSTYCIDLEQSIKVIAMFTANPVNFPSLQFSLSVNSLVIFLFSKYPFNFGYANNFCINNDEFGFAEVGTTFDIDLSNYQNYYMLILIYPQGIDLSEVKTCQIVPNLTMTFQNTTISSIQNMTIQSNYDQQEKSGFCTSLQIQTTIPQAYCSNYTVYPMISLDNLNNYLVINTCQAFLIQNNTTVEFITPYQCYTFGANVTAPITFNANQQVIDFLNNNNISYIFVSFSPCKTASKISPYHIPCKSIYQISKLLTPIKKYSLISSKLWNEIVQDLYLAYIVYKYINYLSQFPYSKNIYSAIFDFYNFYENFQPYIFKPLIHARKGLPLTADYFNSLIDAVIELANFANIQLQKEISHVQPDQIVRSLQFDNIIYNVNQLLTFNFNQYFLLDCSGNKFNSLLNSTSTFLNVLIYITDNFITIPYNVYIKNFLIYNNLYQITIYGIIANLIMTFNQSAIVLEDNGFINSLIVQNNNGTIEIEDNSNVNILQIDQNLGVILILDNASVNTLKINNNYGLIYIENNAIVENLICNQNSGFVNIYGNGIVLNNQCA